ncbi:MAG: hypothetical protein RSC93_00485 [Erysipelotrichaceae bacterium]
MEKQLVWKLKLLYRNLESGYDFVIDKNLKYGQCLFHHSKILESIGAVYIEKENDFYVVNVDDQDIFMLYYKSNIERIIKLYYDRVVYENSKLSNSRSS